MSKPADASDVPLHTGRCTAGRTNACAGLPLGRAGKAQDGKCQDRAQRAAADEAGTDRKRTTISGSLEDPSGLEGLVVLGDGSVLSDLSVIHSGATDTSIAVSVPVTSEGVEITDVRLSSGAGSATGYAVMVDGGEVLVRASILEGGVGNDGTANIVNSQLAVSGATGVGAYRCVGAYDGAYSPLNSDCG